MQIKKISDEITKQMQDWRNYKEEKKENTAAKTNTIKRSEKPNDRVKTANEKLATKIRNSDRPLWTFNFFWNSVASEGNVKSCVNILRRSAYSKWMSW